MQRIPYLLFFLSFFYLSFTEHVGYDSINLLAVDNERSNSFVLLSVDVKNGSITSTDIFQVDGEIIKPTSVFDPYKNKYYVAYELGTKDGSQKRLSIINFEDKTKESDIAYIDENDYPIPSLTFDMSTKEVVALFISPNNVDNVMKAIDFNDGKILWRIRIPSSRPITISSDKWTNLTSYLERDLYNDGYFSSKLVVKEYGNINFTRTRTFSDMEFGSIKGYFTNGSVLAIGRYIRSKSNCGLYKISLLDSTRPQYIIHYPPLTSHKTISLAATSYIDETLTFYSALVPEGSLFKIMTTDIHSLDYSETIKFNLNTVKYNIIGMNVELNDDPIFQPVYVPESKPPSDGNKRDGQKVGLIVGIILGGIAIVGLIIGIIVFKK